MHISQLTFLTIIILSKLTLTHCSRQHRSSITNAAMAVTWVAAPRHHILFFFLVSAEESMIQPPFFSSLVLFIPPLIHHHSKPSLTSRYAAPLHLFAKLQQQRTMRQALSFFFFFLHPKTNETKKSNSHMCNINLYYCF